nr:MAG TPA: hypothetical protein [Caudoviricetes sp.]
MITYRALLVFLNTLSSFAKLSKTAPNDKFNLITARY